MAEFMELETLLTPEQVAEKLSIGRSTVYHLQVKGILPGLKIGGAVRFRPAAVLKFMLDSEKNARGDGE